MPEFNTSLLREKFTIYDAMPADLSDKGPVVALSNRLSLPLKSDDGKTIETFIIRAQNMHMCARIGAQIASEFQENGPLLGRKKPFDWHETYETLIRGYEKKWNPNRWVAIYHKGRVIFEDGAIERHPFLDIIEQCDARNKDNYEKAVSVAQDAFKQAGRLITIDHDSNIALILAVTPLEGKCGVIVRGPSRTTTFNLTAHKKNDHEVRVSNCLSAAAAFLEGIQLAFFIGMTRKKILYEMISGISPEAKQAEDAGQKLGRLNTAISQFESLLDVTYRPERPEFSRMISDAEDFARKIFAEQAGKK